MAGLVPAIQRPLASGSIAQQSSVMRGGWVYVMTNRPNGTLYVGVTSDLARRVWEHKEGVVEGFNKRYGLKRLVLAERFEDIETALQREKNMKHWPRHWKLRVISEANPNWDDLYDRLP